MDFDNGDGNYRFDNNFGDYSHIGMYILPGYHGRLSSIRHAMINLPGNLIQSQP